MLVISHRGYHARVPENTLEAFEEAVEMGVDGIETDVQIGADGVPILFHGGRAPDGRDVSELEREELSAMLGYKVPTLEEALEKWSAVLWNLDIKSPLALDAVEILVKRYRRTRRFLITSFQVDIVLEIYRRVEVDCGLLLAHRPPGDASSPVGLWPDDLRINTVVWKYEILDPEALWAANARGMRNFAYHVQTQEEHKRCARLKLAGVITDHPEFFTRR